MLQVSAKLGTIFKPFGKLIILLTKLLPYLALKYCIFYISVNVFSLGTGEEMLHRHEWVTT